MTKSADESSTAIGLGAGSPDRFGYEWAHYSEVRPEYEEQFRRWTIHLAPKDWQRLRFLDVGCGMGRNSLWPMRYGAAGGSAIDVDARSLAAARRTLAGFPTVAVRQLSAYDCGEDGDGGYDIAFSIGVIHHLEFPERAVCAMTRAVRPGGRVLIWVYGRENNGWIVLLLDPLRKALFSQLPLPIVHHLSLYPALLVWVAVRIGIGRIEYFKMLRSIAFRHLRSIVFDQMLPKIAHYWTRDESIALLRQAGLVDVEAAWVNEMSWSVVGRRPAGERV
ncbi:MAG: methyltransferase [Rhodospirillales bacterium]|nr:methyltransferase [Rhodospirillales bacterium]